MENCLRLIAVDGPADSMGWALDTCPTPYWPFFNWVEVNPVLGLGLSHPLCRQLITSKNSCRHTWKMKKARRRLAVALREAGLSKEAERVQTQDRHPEIALNVTCLSFNVNPVLKHNTL